jgi:uncharacterized protein involved in tolerance to divalent cations
LLLHCAGPDAEATAQVIDNVLIVLTNCPDTEVADRLARTLVEQKLAACVNRLPAVNSVYRWQGAVERAIEVPLLIKSTRTRFRRLSRSRSSPGCPRICAGWSTRHNRRLWHDIGPAAMIVRVCCSMLSRR